MPGGASLTTASPAPKNTSLFVMDTKSAKSLVLSSAVMAEATNAMAEEESNPSPQPDPESAEGSAHWEESRVLAWLERYKAVLQAQLEQYKAAVPSSIEQTKAINDVGRVAMRTALIINGAAAIALLAYHGNSNAEPGLLIPLAMLIYLVGVAAAAIAPGFTYLAVRAASDHEDADAQLKAFTPGNNTAIVLVPVAHLAFIVAGLLAFLHFTGWVVPGS